MCVRLISQVIMFWSNQSGGHACPSGQLLHISPNAVLNFEPVFIWSYSSLDSTGGGPSNKFFTHLGVCPGLERFLP